MDLPQRAEQKPGVLGNTLAAGRLMCQHHTQHASCVRKISVGIKSNKQHTHS